MVSPSARRLLTALSGVLALLAATAAGAGLADPSLYRPSTPDRLLPGVASQDLLTLVAAVGIVACLAVVRRGDRRAWLVWVGLVGYLLYAYALYAFEKVYNPLFLVYVAVLGLSLWCLVLFFRQADLGAVRPRPGRRPPRRVTAFVFLFLVVLFLALWLSLLLPAMATRTAPDGNAVFVLDLTFFLPLLAVEAGLLLRGTQLGDALAVPILAKVASLGSSVLLGTLLQPLFGGEIAVGEVLTYAAMGLAPLALLVPFLRSLDVRG